MSALGQDLGFAYERGCVLADGTPKPPAVTRALRATCPTGPPRTGRLAGHIGRSRFRRSTSTTRRSRSFLVLTVGRGVRSQRRSGPLQVLQIGHDPLDRAETDLHVAYGITSTGAVLVRPDGHVAWRAPSLPADPAATLRTALNALGLRVRGHHRCCERDQGVQRAPEHPVRGSRRSRSL